MQPEKLPQPPSVQAEQECSQEKLRDGSDQAEKVSPTTSSQAGQVEQVGIAENDTVGAEHQASAGRRSLELRGDQSEQHPSIEHTICTISSGYRDNLYARQPLTIQRAVARYVECPHNNSSDQLLTNNCLGNETEMDQAEKLRADHPVEPDESPPTSGQSEQECSLELLRDDRGRAEHPVKSEKWIREGSDQAEKVEDGTD